MNSYKFNMLDKSTIEVFDIEPSLDEFQVWIQKQLVVIVNNTIINLKYVVSIQQIQDESK